MNGLWNLRKRVQIDMGDIPLYKYAGNENGMSRDAINAMKNGQGVSMRTVQKFADYLEIPGPVAFTDPMGDIPDDICAADLSYIPFNVSRLRKEHGLTIKKLANIADIDAVRLEKIECGLTIASTVDVQEIADALEVEITDLMLPPPKPADIHGDPYTHASYLPFNARTFVNRMKLKNGSFDVNTDILHKITQGAESIRLSSVDKIAKETGVSIAEFFLKPGIQTEWYRESKAEYFSANMVREMNEQGKTSEQIARTVKVSEMTIRKTKQGRLPIVRTAQDIADALGIELGDLFLPPEG